MIKILLGILLLILAIVLLISYKYNEEGFTNSNTAANPVTAPSTTTLTGTNISTVTPATNNSTVGAAKDTVMPESLQLNTNGKSNMVTLSPESIDALVLQLKSKVLGDTQKSIKNETLVERQTKPVSNGNDKTVSITPASQQGKEYDESKPCPEYPDGSCPTYPDMSKYIKKDSIPCWNCSLDY
jgi:hypothetical protein